MPAITDLTWQQLRDGFIAIGLSQVVNRTRLNPENETPGIYNLILDLTKVPGWEDINLADEGVIWFASRFLDACKEAQNLANQNQAVGERLNAFPNAVVANSINGFVPVTRTVVGRHDLSSSNRIIGANV